MGVTIHFEGQLKNDEVSYKGIIEEAIAFADSYGMEHKPIYEACKKLSRVREEEPWDYEGPVKGLKIILDDHCDPLFLEFDETLYIQEFIKTQFVGAETHIIVIQLLRSFKKFFVNLIVEDEAEYWDTSDKKLLEEHIAKVNSVIEDQLKSNPKLSGPVRSSDGRILDLVEND
tara:strand:+ start:24489 stop:25007 length:519 start_codon:yes stop_codon:yes gene_type:complete